ncbi:methionyl-tRNA formyltransferase [Mycoplasma crocodyli]|uniref:Methionyl-tRNA formyltransferase n=1 Tax=Mycoplasma crocodyli (strain ATCC 51981 / MP145) TaxID=512564 RepID=D5E5Y5_MYCCM|nr:methionyl-tRNA formyltransferase [Mycoplasma crocodyli]ADE19768.1 methionyl-tRNA formyltransferase [Mycoplasma crocodyli MP145]
MLNETKKIKIVLAGTPDFSVPIFEEVINNFEVLAIISQPDRPKNRGYSLEETPTKKLAKKYKIKIYQPNKISEIYQELSNMEFDFFLTAAFGQYIPNNVLELPKIASLNIHGSLLPKYRGAAPIQYSLLNGDTETGISLIYMTKIMDAGNILKIAKLPINKEDTSTTMFSKISNLATKNITNWLYDIYNNNFDEIIQDETKVMLSPKLLKEDSEIKNSDSVEFNFNKIRAFSENPGAYITKNNKRIKIFYATKSLIKNAPIIDCSDGFLYATDYQFESKKRITIK